MQLSKPVISSTILNDEFGMVEYASIEMDLLYLKNICSCYVFTEEVHKEMTQK